MAILHRAYRFQPAAFVRAVASLAPAGEGIDADGLRARARRIMEGGEIPAEVLEDLRYAAEWLVPDRRADRLPESLALLLAGHLHRVPGLSDERPDGHRILMATLADAGWATHEIALLLEGRPLATLLARVPLPGFVETFGGFGVFGGWIPDPAVLSLATRVAEVHTRSEEQRRVLASATRMLAEAAEHHSALFVILD